MKNKDKKKYDFKSVFKEYGCVQIEPMDVYRDIFKLGKGYIQKKNEKSGGYKSNPIAYFKNDGQKHGRFRIMFEDQFEEIYRKELVNADFCIMNGLTYFGRKYISRRSSKMYAMIFDIDGITGEGLRNFLYAAHNTRFDYYPLPNYIVLSGHGVHMYYVFEEPISLYPYTKIQLKDMKYSLTRLIWNKTVSNDENVQLQGINQAFRIIGGKTKKNAKLKRSVAYRVSDVYTTIEELNKYVNEDKKVDLTRAYAESKMSLEEAKIKYPEWYHCRIEQRIKLNPWKCNRGLYEWWIKQIQNDRNGATYGHRYFCIMTLAIFAEKCGISEEELTKDAYSLIPFLNNLKPENPFTKDDVDSALECFDAAYITFPRKDIEKITGIRIDPSKSNGRKQDLHLAGARAIQKINDEANGTNWRQNNGRKPKKSIVLEWRANNPYGSKAECIRDTKLDKKTVYKWWN